MDFIKRRQPLNHQKESFPKKSKDRIRKLVSKSITGFFSLGNKSRKPFVALTLPVQGIDREGNILISIPKEYDSVKGNLIRLLFQGKAFSDFLLLEGNFSISRDKKIKVTPTEAYCWDAKQKKVAALTKNADSKSRDSFEAIERKVRTG